MQGTMQVTALTINHIFERAERFFGHKHVTTAQPSGPERITYRDWAERTHRLGGVLDTLGLSDDARVATFAWNTSRHLELYFA
ncbi:MAG: fatty acid--CoA ligase, partial [Actinomycetota bacterium]|nr:fatty acid--CoA ligase [Actinomycetota bacterium]